MDKVEYELWRYIETENAKNGDWKQRDGSKIPLEEMSDNHLLNTYNKVKKELSKAVPFVGNQEIMWIWETRLSHELERRK